LPTNKQSAQFADERKIGIYSEHGSAWISPDQTTERPGRECQSSSLGGV
jgi:hypothetical protein